MFHAAKLLETGLPDLLTDRSEQIGARILGQAMKVPIRQLIQNKTGTNGAEILDQIIEREDLFTGYDIKN